MYKKIVTESKAVTSDHSSLREEFVNPEMYPYVKTSDMFSKFTIILSFFFGKVFFNFGIFLLLHRN